jgi:hypothetical protein
MNPDWYDKDFVAEALDCSEQDIERWVKRGKLRKKIVKGKELYDPDDVIQISQEPKLQNSVFSTAEDLDQAIDSIEFINEPWLPRGLVTLLVASPGIGKSKLALDVTRRILNPKLGWFDGQDLEVPTND